jgi:NTP pyrophosphatase (non-canonical NTP hydrolase)
MSNNQLNEMQNEAAAILNEECGETVQAISKLNRHGKIGVDDIPGGTHQMYDNIELLAHEVYDILAAIVICRVANVLPTSFEDDEYAVERINTAIENKLRRTHNPALRERVRKFLDTGEMPS